MDQPTKNTLTRLTKISRYFEGQPEAVASLPALAESVAAFEALRAALPALPAADAAAGLPTTGTLGGATEDKGAARAALNLRLIPAFNALKLYFKKAGDLERSRQFDLTRPSQLRTIGAGVLARLATDALAALDALPQDALQGYGLGAPEVEQLRTAATTFNGRATRPQQVRDSRVTAAQTLEQQLRQTTTYVDDDLTSAVYLLHERNPEFVRGFKQANKTDDLRGGRTARKEGPSTTD